MMLSRCEREEMLHLVHKHLVRALQCVIMWIGGETSLLQWSWKCEKV